MKRERENETHPAFGMARVSRVSQSPPGATLFDSDIRHQHYITLTISRATRDRALQRDWIHGTQDLIEVAMSEAQWASLVSSVNTSGVPVTLRRTESEVRVEGLPHNPRLALSHAETLNAAHRAFAAIKEARDAYAAHKTAANLRTLHYAIENAAVNVGFAAESLSKHAENVVQKARADVEAMVVSKAHALDIASDDIPRLELGGDS